MDKALLGINLNGILMGVFKKRIKPDKARELIMEDVEQYTQQVSREVAIDFGRWKQSSRYELMPSDFADYIKWKSNQEDK